MFVPPVIVEKVTKATKAFFENLIAGIEEAKAEAVSALSVAVRLTGDQLIAGIKTFASSPKVPEPSVGGDAASKAYVDAAAAQQKPGMIEHAFTPQQVVAGALPGFSVELAASESKKLIGIRTKLPTGTSVVVEVRRNGIVLAGLTLTVEKAKGSQYLALAEPLPLAAGDFIDIVLSAVTGPPVENLSVTVSMERIATSNPPAATTYSGFTPANMPPATWTPYAGGSLWNKLIGGAPSLVAEPLQKEITDYITKNHAAPQPGNSVAYASYPANEFGHPLYWAATTDELFEIVVAGSGLNGTQIRMPGAALPASGSDHHLIVVQPNGDEYDFYNAKITGKKIEAEAVYKTSITGIGKGTATAANFALLGGIIRPEELIGGVIRHALFITVSNCTENMTFPGVVKSANPATESNYVWPATHGGAKAADTAGRKPPPMGARLWLEMTHAEIDALGLPAYSKAIAYAMADYGGFVGDTSGGGFIMAGLSPRSYNAFGLANPLFAYGAAHGLLKVNEGGIDGYVYKPADTVPWATKLRVLQAPSGSETL